MNQDENQDWKSVPGDPIEAIDEANESMLEKKPVINGSFP